MLNTLLVNTDGVNHYARILNAFRLKSVEIWCMVGSNAGLAELNMTWNSDFAPEVVVSDQTLGVSRPLHFKTRPPAGSTAGFWGATGLNESAVLFQIDTPTVSGGSGTHTLIEVDMECVISFANVPKIVVCTQPNSAGQVCQAYLDGIVGGAKIPPVPGGILGVY